MARLVAYHGASAAEHKQRFDKLAPQGFRLTALTVSGDTLDARYAAVWDDRPGPAWKEVHGIDAAQYRLAFTDAAREGFAPIIISATGPSNSAIFAAVFEQGHNSAWFAHHGMKHGGFLSGGENTEESFVSAQKRAKDQGFIPKSLCVYGDSADTRFAGIWHANTQQTAWSWRFADPAFYQRVFDAQEGGHMRPGVLDVADDGMVLVVFQDDWVGAWSARHDIDAAEYERDFDANVAAGRFPLVLAAGGSGVGTRYAVLSSEKREAEPRSWQVIENSSITLSGLNRLFQTFMAENGIRAASLAICRNGEPLVQCGYTWAENGYPQTQPDSLFRMASLSKLFTAAAIDRLTETHRLSLDAAAFPLLGISTARLSGQTVDPRTDTITLRQLIGHRSGISQNAVGTPRDVAARLGLARRITKRDLAELAYGEPLEYPPDQPPAEKDSVYLNLGYSILALIVEQVSGMPFIDYLRSEVLPPSAQIWLGGTERSQLRPGEVTYDDPCIGLSMLEPTRDLYLPAVYGGSFDLELADGTGGLIGSATAVANFIATHAVWGIGGRMQATRFGAAPGDCSAAVSRGDGLDVCYMFNRWRNIEVFNVQVQSYLDAHPL